MCNIVSVVSAIRAHNDSVGVISTKAPRVMAKKTKELEPAEIRLDGHVTLSNHGCSSDLEINGKEPILSDKSLAKGDRYSMDGCPKL